MPWVSATPPKGGCDTPFLWGVKEKSHQCILNEGRLVQNIYVYTYVFIIDIYNIYIHLCNDIHLLKLFMVEMIFQTGGLKYGKKHIGKGKEWSQKKKKNCVLQLLVFIQQAIHHLPIILFLGTSVTLWMHRIHRCETPHSQLTQKRLSNKKIWI